MRRVRMGLFGGIAAAALGTVMWTVPAWGQSATPARTGAAGSTATTGGSPSLTNQLAAMRLATAKYSTNLNRAKAAGYQVITPMMPNMGIHYMNPSITGFDIRKPQILVYEHRGNTWQLGALEWVFPSVPKTPPLRNATFGFFPAACHYKDGTFIPDENSNTCPPTNPKTGSPFNFWHPDLSTMHVWIWYPNPAGLYSSTNPLVHPFNGG
jgi:hypothetical protein